MGCPSRPTPWGPSEPAHCVLGSGYHPRIDLSGGHASVGSAGLVADLGAAAPAGADPGAAVPTGVDLAERDAADLAGSVGSAVLAAGKPGTAARLAARRLAGAVRVPVERPAAAGLLVRVAVLVERLAEVDLGAPVGRRSFRRRHHTRLGWCSFRRGYGCRSFHRRHHTWYSSCMWRRLMRALVF